MDDDEDVGQYEILAIETLDGDTSVDVVNVPKKILISYYSHHHHQNGSIAQDRLNAIAGTNNKNNENNNNISTFSSTTFEPNKSLNQINKLNCYNQSNNDNSSSSTLLATVLSTDGNLMDGSTQQSNNQIKFNHDDVNDQQSTESKLSNLTDENEYDDYIDDDFDANLNQDNYFNDQQKDKLFLNKKTDVDLLVNILIKKKQKNKQNLDTFNDNGDNLQKELNKNNHLKCFASIFKMVANCRYKNFYGLNLCSKKTIIFPLILILSVIALVLLHNGSLNTRKTLTPKKIFTSNNPFIAEFEFGQLKDLWNRLVQNEIAFIIYYAPWDSDCIRARNEIEVVANHYGQQVFFGAINCWWPEGECRKYQNFKRFPHFVAYIRSEGEIEYKGPVLASYIIPFLDNIMNPLIPVQNEGELLDLRAQHDAVVLGYFDFNQNPTNQPGGYRSYLTTSIKALVNDPWRTVVYTVVTNARAASKLKIDPNKATSLILYVGNTTEHFTAKYSKPFTLLSWIYSRAELATTIKWMNPSGIKSTLISDFIRKTPTFVLFTPRSFLLGISPYHDLLREIVLDYYNCDKSPIIRSLIHRNILRRRLLEERLAELEERCHELLDMKDMKIDETIKTKFHDNIDTCCHTQTVKWRSFGGRRHGMTKTCLCTSCVHISLPKCPAKCSHFDCLSTAARYLDEFDPNYVNNSAVYCNQIKNSYQPKYTPYYKIVTSCSGNLQEFGYQDIAANNDVDDGWWNNKNHHQNLMATTDEKINRMIQEFEKQHCRKLKLGMNYTDLNFPETNEQQQINNRKINNLRANFTGLACRTNRTLKFMAFDSLLYQAFAESLGIDVFNVPHSTIALIIDPIKESVHVLNHEIVFDEQGVKREGTLGVNDFSVPKNSYSKNVFIEFIKNFTDGTLPRFYRNQIQSSGFCDLKQKLIPKLSSKNDSSNIICVPELNSITFVNLVLGKSFYSTNRQLSTKNEEENFSKFLDKDVIIMYYAPWCGFCSAIAHIYLDVARFFDFSQDIVFARINGDANDLPWEYTVDRYPTIIFFPSKKRSQSVIYPPGKEINQLNLFRFILENAQLSVKIQMSVLFCHKTCLQKNLLKNYFQRHSTDRAIKYFQNNLILFKDLAKEFKQNSKQQQQIKDSKLGIKKPSTDKNLHHPNLKQINNHLNFLRTKLKLLKRRQKRQILLSHFILLKTDLLSTSMVKSHLDQGNLQQQLYWQYYKNIDKNQKNLKSNTSNKNNIKNNNNIKKPNDGKFKSSKQLHKISSRISKKKDEL